MNIYLKEKNIQGEKAMQIQAIIQEIVCIIDEDGSDRFELSVTVNVKNLDLKSNNEIKLMFSIEMEDLIKVFKEEILGGTASLIEGNY